MLTHLFVLRSEGPRFALLSARLLPFLPRPGGPAAESTPIRVIRRGSAIAIVSPLLEALVWTESQRGSA